MFDNIKDTGWTLGCFGNYYPQNYGEWLFSNFLQQNNQSLYSKIMSINVEKNDLIKLDELIKKHLGKKVFDWDNVSNHSQREYFLNEEKNIFTGISLNGKVSKGQTYSFSLEFTGNDNNLLKKLVESFEALSSPIPQKPYIHVLAQGSGGLYFSSLGDLKYTFNKDNYENNVAEAYDYIVEQFSKDEPLGRLVIANGQAGTGKTNMIKGLLTSIKNNFIILVPAKLISEIDSPSFTDLLLEERNEGIKMPFTIVVEDADLALARRATDNISAISSLLNLTDGIFGSMLDLRIIASTNVEKLDFDEALLRPGRLCRHITVGLLSAQKANQVMKRLSGKEGKYTKPTTLATVYGDYNKAKNGYKKEDTFLGFTK